MASVRMPQAIQAPVGNQMAGAVGMTSVFGGTNSLVPVDDMQEFRIQTSTFSPEFGRTPGAQISIVTRSGNNSFHGSAFDYLRNDVLDAKNWFNGYTHNPPLKKAEERQNDFGGTFGGPILKNRTFFFFSYEGLRLRLPATTLSTVPDLAARQNAVPALQPLLNGFPLPTGPAFDTSGAPLPGQGEFDASYSNPATLDDYNLRIDHRLTEKINFFARYNNSPSTIASRGGGGNALSMISNSTSVAQQLTAGVMWGLSPRIFDEFRFNYSRTDASGSSSVDHFGGAVPFSPTLPSPYDAGDSNYGILILSLQHGNLVSGPFTRNVQHQINVVDTATFQLRAHNVKVGIDYRRLTPDAIPFSYGQQGFFLDVSGAVVGLSDGTSIQSRARSSILFKNLGVFAQDTWRIIPNLTLSYGLRWDTDFAPKSTSGAPLVALANFNANDLSTVTLAPAGTPPFHTDFGNVAPRVGLAYRISPSSNWGQTVRGGFGIFYDLATSEIGNAIAESGYPYLSNTFVPAGTPFPMTGSAALPAPIQPPTPQARTFMAGVDPNLKSPYTWEWNVALEQQLGLQQVLSFNYVGAAGRRLLQTTVFLPTQAGQLNPAFRQLVFAENSATSDYQALQIQFNRRLEKNLQVLASYTWSHSIDTASAGSGSIHTDASPGANVSDRGPSDFDIRHTFTVGSTYELPSITSNRLLHEVTRGWSFQNSIQARTAPPLTVSDGSFFRFATGYRVAIRPDVVTGVPLYLYGSQYPGGKAINFTPGAVAAGCPGGSESVGPFCSVPSDPNFNPVRQGTLGRNALRGFGAFQWDLGIHRNFPIRESLRLEFRAEMFNVLNHPNFAPPASDITDTAGFGRSTQTLSDYLGGGFGVSGLSSIYQIGGPRSVQFALKLMF